MPDPHAAMVSITDPGERSPVRAEDWGMYLHSAFTDSEYNIATFQTMGAAVFREVFGSAITAAQAMQIRQFLADCAQNPHISRLEVHCHRGRSRSAAVALYTVKTHRAVLAGDADTREHNRLVYAMLENPLQYQRLFAMDSGVPRDAQPPPTWWLGLKRWFQQSR